MPRRPTLAHLPAPVDRGAGKFTRAAGLLDLMGTDDVEVK
jgi:hypothetical protein